MCGGGQADRSGSDDGDGELVGVVVNHVVVSFQTVGGRAVVAQALGAESGDEEPLSVPLVAACARRAALCAARLRNSAMPAQQAPASCVVSNSERPVFGGAVCSLNEIGSCGDGSCGTAVTDEAPRPHDHLYR
jgi:hypothetical protein